MKKKYNLLMFSFLLFTSINVWSQITITRWNFNGTAADAVAGGATSPTPTEGNGSASLLNGVTATFASGTASGGSSDPVTTTPDNFGWNTSTYAALGTENKLRGIQFNISTVNYQGIKFIFDQRLSNTANNTYVVQYSTNGTNWIDAETFTFTPAETGTGDTWYNLRTVDLTAVTALNNNPNAGFRIVSAFDPTTNDYRAARSTSTYGPGGTVRFDMVTLTAESSLSLPSFDNQNSLLISPNPSSNGVMKLNQVLSFEVFDYNGKKLFNVQNSDEINTSNLPTGMYIIKTDTGLVQKIIVK
ncbi:MAG: T9SS type A sorting domain-containing protein [Flavobacterium sp.]|jgi:hypothetical protein|uniref:T9SS type A sorting domain-containing protein n=1 Tax=Flavobacterium sp. TaxID=239 RepID=UPI003BA6D49B